MNGRWAAQFPHTSLPAALPLRRMTDVLVHIHDDVIWLKGRDLSDPVEALLRCIPDIVRYSVAPDERITRLGFRIPAGALPGGAWTSLASLVRFSPQPAALPAHAPSPVQIRLVRSNHADEPGAMVLPIDQWTNYTLQAPQIRLVGLCFAACADSRVLVAGRPLPPLRGTQYVDHSRVLVPAGYAWTPAIEPALLRRTMNLADGDIALLALDGSYERIAAENIVPASRSAARLTLVAMQADSGVT